MDGQGVVFAIGAVLLGAIAGSFLNVLSFRFGTGRSVIYGRSHCMRCGHVLTFFDLIPVFSYLALAGRCRYCSSAISLQYPLVEISAALLSLGIYLLVFNPYWFCYWFIVWMTLLFIVVYDLRHAIIPRAPSLLLVILGFGRALFLLPASPHTLLAGVVLALPLFLLSFVSKGQWMGWGDGILELSLGWLLGFSLGLTALMLAFWSGAGIGIVLLFASRRWKTKASRFTMKSEIPFAPFLVLGAAIVYFLHVDLFFSLSSLLS